ncbi:Lysosomal thiol [Perkinsus chesapeaki]|uniref:Lysosomal thiol n=1 Tax=Perkinsus chesapeaki TaxID=330153 RepID=A0A7J6M6G7_PERCH|nr:Lysosomal thiol [Perkinsus chesapeaki]
MIKIVSAVAAVAAFTGYSAYKSVSSPPPPTMHFKLYYETLCPYCQRFMVDQVAPFVDDPETAKFVNLDLQLVPYGNVRNGTCQHGDIECAGNAYHRCVIDVMDNDPAKYLPVILCMEKAFKNYNFTGVDYIPMETFALTCMEEGSTFDGMRFAEVEMCYTSPEWSAKLEDAAKNNTDSLDPPKEYVPWLTDADGKQLSEAYADFKTYVCGYLKNNSFVMPRVCRPTISLNLYYGSLDPASTTFISDQLNPALTAFDGYANLNISLVPYGQMVTSFGGAAYCVHGTSECALNAYQRCVVDAFDGDAASALATVACMTNRLANFTDVMAFWFQFKLEAVAAGCIGVVPGFTGAKFGAVEHCHYNYTMNQELFMGAKNATAKVSMPITGGPLLTKPDGTDMPGSVYTDFQGYLCKLLDDGDYEQPPVCLIPAGNSTSETSVFKKASAPEVIEEEPVVA